MNEQERKLRLYYGQILELIRSLKGENVVGKLFRNNQRIKHNWFRTAENILAKMVDIDKDSLYVKDIREKLYNDPYLKITP